MATTVGDIIRSAMRKVGVLAAGEPLPADEGDDALKVFTQLVDSWTNETLLIPVVNVVTKQLIDGVSSYTIGVYSGDEAPDYHIETARPERIISAFIRDSSGTDYHLKEMNSDQYSRLNIKDSVARPARFYLRKGWPTNEILFESIPYAGETLHMEVVQPLSEVLPAASLTEEINLPPGYERALIFNLCLDLADEWGKSPSAAVATHAVEGKKLLKRNNYRDLILRVDKAISTTRRSMGTYQIQEGP